MEKNEIQKTRDQLTQTFLNSNEFEPSLFTIQNLKVENGKAQLDESVMSELIPFSIPTDISFEDITPEYAKEELDVKGHLNTQDTFHIFPNLEALQSHLHTKPRTQQNPSQEQSLGADNPNGSLTFIFHDPNNRVPDGTYNAIGVKKKNTNEINGAFIPTEPE